MKEEKEFQTESKQLLNLMVNSIYTDKEIFLREILSNASDAIDKYKYLALTSNGKYPQRDYQINIVVDKKARTIEISDNGIGMTKDDIVNNLGVIAKSGSKEFLEKAARAKDKKEENKEEAVNIIGQFGVGFYSAFMVAKKVEVRTKNADDKGYLFESDGVSKYTISDIDKKEQGSAVKIFLKNDTDEEKYSDYLETYKIEDLVKKYSDYIRYPIKMDVTTSKPKLDKDGKPIEGKYEDVVENKTLNSMVPLWKKPRSKVTQEEMEKFYTSRFNDYEKPLLSIFVKAEGLLSYNALLYVPGHAPYNLYSENYEKGIALYSKGIFIKEKCPELIPDYLKFVKGLVDSDDFSLNISRELLQNSPVMKKIAKNIETKLVSELLKLKKDDYEKYLKFFKIYGNHIKFGIYSSYGSKNEELKDLLIYKSLNDEKPIDLKTYVDKMGKDQKYIYFASGKNIESIKLLPQLEKYKKSGENVLLMDENIDEFTIMMLREYDKKQFKNISDESSEELSKEEKDEIESLTAKNKRLLDDIKEVLKDKVDDVGFSTKLVDSPVCIVTKDGLSMNMEHVINEEQPGNKDENEKVKSKKLLQINPNHELFKAISNVEDDDLLKQYGSLLYDEAVMLEGFEVKDKKAFVENLNSLMLKTAKVKKD
ncbi:MAG: molecular chaperone HtpG [Bacilli bacterium]